MRSARIVELGLAAIGVAAFAWVIGSVAQPPKRAESSPRRSLPAVAAETPESLSQAFANPAAFEDYSQRDIQITGTVSRVEHDAIEYAVDGKIVRVLLAVPPQPGCEVGATVRAQGILAEIKKDLIVLENGAILLWRAG